MFLRSSFYFFDGLNQDLEMVLWASGIHSWDDFLNSSSIPSILQDDRIDILSIKSRIRDLDSKIKLDGVISLLSSDLLKCFNQEEIWRLCADFYSSIAYLDIETTGLSPIDSHITVIAVYAEGQFRYYVKDRDMDRFLDDIKKYPIIVTYNGVRFDIPFIEKELNTQIRAIQIDLRYILDRLGYKGGLKKCEKKLNCSNRMNLEDIDGKVAVYLWKYYKKHHSLPALETLVFYNLVDAINLECLMVKAYNLNLKKNRYLSLPFLEIPTLPQLNYVVDQEIINKILLTSI